ncbi:PAS domain-containing protein [Rhodoferax ferrireducens]|uniref:PAS domain-containing protein n=1 Tax=Rhodoferax ferrireducens TaxID=192843 RepID=UPI000E0D5DCF|nr:PAS domain-containing protein [Rhodoferax ferrireducens]
MHIPASQPADIDSASFEQRLRQRANELVSGKVALSLDEIAKMTPEDTQRLFHELQVHQVELEMQNDELRRVQDALHTERERYFDLYELAPVGYCTVSKEGLILQINLTAATLVGINRRELVRRPISRFICKEDRDIYYLLCKQLLATGEPQSSELRMLKKDGTPFWVELQATAARDETGAPVHRFILSDMMARQSLQEVRDEALSRLQKIASRVPGMVYQYRMYPDGRSCFPYASDAIVDLFRVTPCDVREDGAPLLALLHPDDFDGVVASIKASARDLTPWHQEYRVKFDDGTVRWVLGTALGEREADGATLWHGFCTDITERKQAEKALRLSEAKIKATLDAIPDLMFELGLDGRYHDVHSPHKELLVAPAQGLIGLCVPDVLQADASKVVMAALQEANEKGYSNGQQFALNLAQGEMWFELSIARKATEPGDERRFIVLSRDITARKVAVEALDQHRRELELLVTARTAELTIALNDSTLSREELLRSQLMLDQATHLAQLGAWSMDLIDLEDFSKNPSAWSLEMFRLLDYKPQDVPVLRPEVFFARVHPQDRQRVIDMAMQALAQRRAWQTEYRLVWADGSEHLVVQTGEFIFDASGKPKSMHGAVKDITQQRQLETQLRDSEARLQMALKGAGAGSFEWNIETGATIWSKEAWVLNGLAPHSEPVSYETWRQTVHPSDLARVERTTEAALSRRAEIEVEWQVNLPTGTAPRWLMSRAQPLPEEDGRIVRYRGIIIDISKRRQAELALELYRDHLEERVAQRTAELVGAEAEQHRLNRALRLRSDCNTAVIHACNERELLDELCRLVVEVGGYLIAWVGVAEQDAAKTVRPVAAFGDATDSLKNNQISWDGAQAIGRGPTGTAIRNGSTQVCQNCWTNPQMAPWREAVRQLGFQSSVALPLTIDKQTIGSLTLHSAEPEAFGAAEVKLLEELASDMAFGLQSLRARRQLEIYQGHLEDLVKQRTQELHALNIALKTKARDADAANLAKGAFLATMSHELRTPLNAVIGLSGLLADSPLNRRQRDYADKIQWSAQALRVLIDDILDFSRIEARELHLERAPFSLSAILRTTAAVLGVGLGDKPIEALFDVAPDLPDALIGDALRLQQILLNLTSNAVKFTSTGEIVVAVRCLTPADTSEGAEVTLQFAVRDTGIGIASEQLGSIFDRFTQADDSTSRLYGGSGLGLAISARLATLMGGSIEVDSSVGRGSEFRLEVPLTLGCSTPQAAPACIPAAVSVLIVDDHPRARDILVQTCAAFGWQAKAVDSSTAGLEELRISVLEKRDYDVLLLDWRMPGQDGLEMLRQAYVTPGIGLPLVVLMAAISELEQAVAASDDLSLDAIAVKPLTPGSLLEAVTRAYTGECAMPLRLVGKSDRRLSGMRLLVAEDNELNQEVIGQMLTRAGAEVVMVGDGVAALAALRLDSGRFDAVLMDIQMPLMDGYTATRIIREELGLLDLPIIAVTAYARPDDREKSRLAGMVGHVVKPLEVKDLLDLLVAERRAVVAPSAERRGDERQAMSGIVALAGLDIDTALQAFGGDAKKYGAILRKFIAQHGGDIEEARRLFGVDDPESTLHLLHGLGGIASFLQAKELARLASAAEEAVREGHADAMPGLFDELQAAMRTVKASCLQFETLYADA